MRQPKIVVSPPKRPFANLLEAKRGRALYNRERCDESGFYPCLNCLGRKDVIAPYEKPDPVEGYKLADRITCPTCNGTGEGTKEAFMKWYKGVLAEWTKSLCTYRQEVKRVKELLKTLSASDIELIQKYL